MVDKNHQLLTLVDQLIDEYLSNTGLIDKDSKFSTYLSETLNHPYEFTSNNFSKQTGLSLEKYFIKKRLEKVKHLLKHTPQSLTEIAYLTGFNTVFHLSRQFKEQTGQTPTDYRHGFSGNDATFLRNSIK